MSKQNPYDLRKKINSNSNSTGSKFAAKLTDAEIKKEVEGYTLIKKEQWKTIPIGSLVRYALAGNQYRQGGVLKSIDLKNTKIGERMAFVLISTTSKHTKSWPVYFDKPVQLWVKPNDTISPKVEIKNNSTRLIENSRVKIKPESPVSSNLILSSGVTSSTGIHITEKLDKLEMMVLNIKNEQFRIIKLIKKLHGI
jgi:hypothetical protein